MLRREIVAIVTLAWPVVLAEIGWVLMGIVDTIVVGRLGPAALGAVGTGSTLFFAFMVLGIGTLFALDTFVSQAYGAGRIADCHQWLLAGLWLAGFLSVGLMAMGLLLVALLPSTGMHPDVLVLLGPYLKALLWSVPPLLVYTVLRRYLQAMGIVRPIMVAVGVANVVNLLANIVLVFGVADWPGYGVMGAAYATFIARVCLVAVLVWVVRRVGSAQRSDGATDWKPHGERIGQLMRLGWPAASQLVLEVGVFATVATLAARISPTAAAANQTVLNIASLFFMVPLGLSTAAAVRVGQAAGRADVPAVRVAGRGALALAILAGSAAAGLFVAAPRPLLAMFTDDQAVLALGATLLLICASFQVFDGLQAVTTGLLRGIGNTRTPMVCNLAAHWLIGLPIATFLCFQMGWGVTGLWTGLSAGLIVAGTVLPWIWFRSTRSLLETAP